VVLNDSADEFEIRPSVDKVPGLIFLPLFSDAERAALLGYLAGYSVRAALPICALASTE
jgi:hypothetical protein